MGYIGVPEILIIFSAILIFFGAKRLPEIAKGLGKGIKDFKSEINSMKETVEPFNKEIKK
ncbi:MAG TPA: twin-arginine translocase TatA/TatE family subunit [Ignavibacteria bacterium]|nr:twin-arginine translocase TatA/TatE family subunit [Ignavibacteria bacterium]